MITVKKIVEVRREVGKAKARGESIGFVPTMGALHEGHAALIRMARKEMDYVVASIFVNPKQFGPGEDYERYPRDIEKDSRLLEELGCDLLFAPEPDEIYTPDSRTRVYIKGLSDVLCGKFRPGHFDGVALIVAKLFNIVQPDAAFFGQKDAQQAVIIQRMVSDLNFPVRIGLHPTVREEDGLAMSSRNAYLSRDERKRAICLFRALSAAKDMIETGERDVEKIEEAMRRRLEEGNIEIDYAEVVDAATLDDIDEISGKVLIAVAGRVGKARLIDNIALDVEGSRVEEIVLEFPEWSGNGK